jgi:hypothetical protein
MATKDFYHNIDLLKVSQLLNARIHNISTSDRTTLGSTLNNNHTGLHVWDIDEHLQYYWSGTTWVQGVATIVGAMVYKGTHADLSVEPSNKEIGHVYVLTTGGTITWATQTLEPNAVVQANDQVVYRGGDIWDVLQGDADEATASTLGLVELAIQAEVNAETDATRVITPATLGAWRNALKIPKVFFDGAVDVVALTPQTITHSLGLQNKDAFTIRVADSSGSDVGVDVDSKTVNSLEITSAISVSNLKVTINGF